MFYCRGGSGVLLFLSLGNRDAGDDEDDADVVNGTSIAADVVNGTSIAADVVNGILIVACAEQARSPEAAIPRPVS